jgi:1-acyl-sn-glycerol-3-phosphate acyltransferase
MIELCSVSDQSNSKLAKNTTNLHVACKTSLISPCLSSLAYSLGTNLLLPNFFGRIEVTGQNNIPATGPVILAPTHRSRWDALLVPFAAGRHVTGRDLRFMVTATECTGVQGWFISRLGGFAVDPQRPSISSLRHAVDLLVDGQVLVIFPEGGIRKGRVHPLKPGIARLALRAELDHPGLGVQILPISINYSHLNPSWGTKVNVDIGMPIEAAKYVRGCIKADAQFLTNDLTKTLQQLSSHTVKLRHREFVTMTNFPPQESQVQGHKSQV